MKTHTYNILVCLWIVDWTISSVYREEEDMGHRDEMVLKFMRHLVQRSNHQQRSKEQNQVNYWVVWRFPKHSEHTQTKMVWVHLAIISPSKAVCTTEKGNRKRKKKKIVKQYLRISWKDLETEKDGRSWLSSWVELGSISTVARLSS